MPELPEIEAVKRVLEPQIQGLVIENMMVKRPEIIACPTADEFCSRLLGQVISHMERRGKYLTIWTVNEDRVILHLRMTGRLLLMRSKNQSAYQDTYARRAFLLARAVYR